MFLISLKNEGIKLNEKIYEMEQNKINISYYYINYLN